MKFLDLREYKRILFNRKSYSATNHKSEAFHIESNEKLKGNFEIKPMVKQTYACEIKPLPLKRQIDFNFNTSTSISFEAKFDMKKSKLIFPQEKLQTFEIMRSESNKENHFKKPRHPQKNSRKALQELIFNKK